MIQNEWCWIFIQSSPDITANLLIEKTNKSVRTIRRCVKSLISAFRGMIKFKFKSLSMANLLKQSKF